MPHFPKINYNNFNNKQLSSPEKLLKILYRLNNPQNKLPPIIHVAGTNGKGSVVATLSSIFQASGYKTHNYTSPHLHHCNERIVIANNQIDDGYLYEILEEIRIISSDTNLNLFEAMTLVAIITFARNKADVCIVEAGMGGEFDATNVLNNKIATILTSISFDHQEFLGNNLSEITYHKSGIMKKNIPCIVAPQYSEVEKIIELKSLEIKNPLIHFDQEFKININNDGNFDFSYKDDLISFLKLPKSNLLGWHQYLNSSLAIATICAIKDLKTANFNISQNNINKGLQTIKLSSRLEKLSYKLLKKDDELWIDGAHNIEGFEVLADWIKEKIIDDEENKTIKKNYLIVGCTKNKTKKEFFYSHKNIIDFICAIRVAGEPNPEEADIITKRILESGIKKVKEEEDLFDAINFLVNLDKNISCRIIICGSLYLARDFKNLNKT